MLNPDSPIPLYHQLAERLMNQIREGEYMTGDVMPSETLLAKHYGIGRPTVRQAMDILVRKGLVQRKRGSGTYVAPRDQQVDLFSLSGTSQAFSTQGIETTYKKVEPVQLKTIQNDTTNPFNGKRAFYMSRLTLVKNEQPGNDVASPMSGEPVLLEDFFLEPEMFRGIEQMDLDNTSLSGVVSDQFYLKPESGRQRFKVSRLKEAYASLLGLEQGDPVLEVERALNFSGAEAAIFSRLFCRTDKFAFTQTMNLENNR